MTGSDRKCQAFHWLHRQIGSTFFKLNPARGRDSRTPADKSHHVMKELRLLTWSWILLAGMLQPALYLWSC